MKKRIISILLTVVILTLTGCGKVTTNNQTGGSSGRDNRPTVPVTEASNMRSSETGTAPVLGIIANCADELSEQDVRALCAEYGISFDSFRDYTIFRDDTADNYQSGAEYLIGSDCTTLIFAAKWSATTAERIADQYASVRVVIAESAKIPDETFVESLSESSLFFHNDLALICAHLSQEIENVYDNNNVNIIKDEYKKLGVSEENIYTPADNHESYYFTLACMKDVRIQGKNYNILIITARGTGGDLDKNWDEKTADAYAESNSDFFEYQDRIYDDSYYFYQRIQEGIEGSFLNDHPFLKSGNLKVVITGHSLGGSAANLVAAAFDKCLVAPKAWWSDLTTKEDIYCYTFGGIGSVDLDYGEDTNASATIFGNINPDRIYDHSIIRGFENIHNVYNYYDSYGPRGNLPLTQKNRNATYYNKFGHVELFGNNSYWANHYSDDVLFETTQHSMATYIDALNDHLKSGLITCHRETDDDPADIPSDTSANVGKDDQCYKEAYLQVIHNYEEAYGTAAFYTQNDAERPDLPYPTAAGLYYANLIDMNGDGVDELILGYSKSSGSDMYQRHIDVWEYKDGILSKTSVPEGEAHRAMHCLGFEGPLQLATGSIYIAAYSGETCIVCSEPPTYGGVNTLYALRDGELKAIATTESFADDPNMYYDFGTGAPSSIDEALVYGLYNKDRDYLNSMMSITKFSLAQEDEIQLSEAELKEIAQDCGSIGLWAYADYDGNGTYEAFFLTVEHSGRDEKAGNVYFINASGYCLDLGSRTGFLGSTASDCFRTCQGKGYFYGDIGSGGSGWSTFLYGVKNGVPYELNVSGQLQGFYLDGDVYYTTQNDFSQGYHTYPHHLLRYNPLKQEFYIAGKLSD